LAVAWHSATWHLPDTGCTPPAVASSGRWWHGGCCQGPHSPRSFPFTAHRQEPEFHRFIKQKNNTIPWFQLANGRWAFAPGAAPHAVWKSPDHYREGVPATTIVAASKGALGDDMRVGFIANELLDPASCSAAVLAQCKGGWCNGTWPLSYLVHHCMNTWRGRIGTT
jgi:hypothetical protein